MTPFFQRQLLCCCAAFLLLSGCAIEPSPSNDSVPIEDMHTSSPHGRHTDTTTENTGTMPSDTSATPQPELPPQAIKNPAAANLLGEAAQARTQGDYARAQTLAERAQTLAPQEARAYLELARIYAQRGDTAHARQMAVRGLSIVRDDPTTERDLQQLSAP